MCETDAGISLFFKYKNFFKITMKVQYSNHINKKQSFIIIKYYVLTLFYVLNFYLYHQPYKYLRNVLCCDAGVKTSQSCRKFSTLIFFKIIFSFIFSKSYLFEMHRGRDRDLLSTSSSLKCLQHPDPDQSQIRCQELCQTSAVLSHHLLPSSLRQQETGMESRSRTRTHVLQRSRKARTSSSSIATVSVACPCAFTVVWNYCLGRAPLLAKRSFLYTQLYAVLVHLLFPFLEPCLRCSSFEEST